MLVATWLGLLSRDLLSQETSSEYLGAFVLFLTGIINKIQKDLVDKGIKQLAYEGDEPTIKKLDEKISETRKIQRGQ